MIIIGCYPESLQTNLKTSPLRQTFELVSELVPSECALHILPPYPSDGDFGFAPSTLSDIDKNYGTRNDIINFCETYRCIFDGIYNHVGNNHPWVKSFSKNCEEYAQYIHAYKIVGEATGPLSPRGQPTLQPAGRNMADWYFWRTFTESAVDIRLENEIVKSYVRDHMDFLTDLGAWAVRLDAVAYYKKNRFGSIRHNSGVIQMANEIAETAASHELKVFTQINRDKEGLAYFQEPEFSSVIINDYTFAVYLALSILSNGNPPEKKWCSQVEFSRHTI